MTDTVRLRETLAAVPAYKPGAPTVAREGVTAYKISSNQNPGAKNQRQRDPVPAAAQRSQGRS